LEYGKVNDVKLIVTDLDNTLLRRDITISDYTIDVLKRIRNRGVLLAFATARDFRFVTEHITPLSGIKPDILIADNGALACYNGVDIYRKMIPCNVVNALISCFKLVRCVSTENAYYLSGEYSNDHWSIGKRETIITDCISNIEDEAFYIDGNIDNSPLTLSDCFPGTRSVSYSDVNLITIVHYEATKLKALFAIKNELNLEMNNIAIFGDDFSDIEMLSYFVNSVTVANAIDECKTVANHLCGDCDEDGVAHWIEENLF
jgi:Cof subfamily protein (haloacid dehalogenase superfamily)